MYAIGKGLIDAIVVLFLLGLAGSAVVVLISFVEDFRELFGEDDATPEPAPPPANASTSASGFSYSMTRSRVHF